MITVNCQDAEATRELGRSLGERLHAGDLILLHGGLGVGKTTFTQGLARGLRVTGRVISPTFIVARIHESAVGGPDLVHVDAYRIEDELDLETLDLDSSLDQAVTVIEWGADKAEVLSVSRLEITLAIEAGTSDRHEVDDWSRTVEEPRIVTFTPVGEEWDRRLVEMLTGLGK